MEQPTQRVVRLWHTSRPDHCRIEFDPQPDGRFSGYWVTRKDLALKVLALLPTITDESLSALLTAFDELAAHPLKTLHYIEARHDMPIEEPVSLEVSDFQF